MFRSRFLDDIGSLVHHCHILWHEDHGIRQVVEVSPFADHVNCEARERVASSADTADALTAIYPRLDQWGAWSQSLCFVDPNHHGMGQTFPGFVAGPPTG